MDDRRWTPVHLLILAAAAWLIADLTLLPWHRARFDFTNLGFTGLDPVILKRTGIQNPRGFLGVAAVVLAAAMAVQVVLRAVRSGTQSTDRPALGDELLRATGMAVLAVVAVKLVSTREFLAIGAWGALAFSAALATCGWLATREPTDPSARPARVPFAARSVQDRVMLGFLALVLLLGGLSLRSASLTSLAGPSIPSIPSIPTIPSLPTVAVPPIPPVEPSTAAGATEPQATPAPAGTAASTAPIVRGGRTSVSPAAVPRGSTFTARGSAASPDQLYQLRIAESGDSCAEGVVVGVPTRADGGGDIPATTGTVPFSVGSGPTQVCFSLVADPTASTGAASLIVT
jgi:hypothetical protein